MQFSAISQRFIPRFASVGFIGKPVLARQFWFDVLAFVMIFGFFVFVSWGIASMSGPIGRLSQSPISLDVKHLPEYALRTTLRMLIAMAASFIFTLIYAALAA